MKVVILAAGYGTRLEKDLKHVESEKHSHLVGLPKSLLPIAGIPLLSYWIRIFKKVEIIEHVYVGTNSKYYEQFKCWAKEWPEFISIVSDGTTDNHSRLGAVGCLDFVCQHFDLHGDMLVMAGDTLFYEDFYLKSMVDIFHKMNEKLPASSLVPVYKCLDEDTVKHGILEVLPNETQVINFLEKPLPQATTSRNACPCFYLLSSHAVTQVSKFLDEKSHLPLEEKDAPGHFLKYLHTRSAMFVYNISGRFDVGNLMSYEKCNNYFLHSKKH